MSLDLPVRSRRLRSGESIRAMLTETLVTPAQLVMPVFITEGGEPEEIASMPGVFRTPLRLLADKCRELQKLGIRGIATFPVIRAEFKDPRGTHALDPQNLALRAIRTAKEAAPDLVVFADIALDPYTTHGHDGILTADEGDVDNDPTVEALAAMSVLTAAAGADFVAPSDMMDGRVGAIRAALDRAGHTRTGILAYSAKFASAFYGPFRDAVGSSRKPGQKAISKKTYQLNPANRREAIADALLDAAEGADMIMVKPAGDYLDILRDLRERCDTPLVAYQVSGEYARLEAAAARGWLDRRACRDESIIAIRRAGADLVITYYAEEFARDLRAGL